MGFPLDNNIPELCIDVYERKKSSIIGGWARFRIKVIVSSFQLGRRGGDKCRSKHEYGARGV